MELETTSPFGDPGHRVVALICGERGCRATTPCLMHEQVIVRLWVDGETLPEFRLGKPAFHELTQVHRNVRELFHMLADFGLLAVAPPETQSIRELAQNF